MAQASEVTNPFKPTLLPSPHKYAGYFWVFLQLVHQADCDKAYSPIQNPLILPLGLLQNPGSGGPEIIQRMLELLSQEMEETCDDWVLHIVQNLVENAPSLVKVPASRKLLCYGLDLPAVAQLVPKLLEVSPAICLLFPADPFSQTSFMSPVLRGS